MIISIVNEHLRFCKTPEVSCLGIIYLLNASGHGRPVYDKFACRLIVDRFRSPRACRSFRSDFRKPRFGPVHKVCRLPDSQAVAAVVLRGSPVYRTVGDIV